MEKIEFTWTIEEDGGSQTITHNVIKPDLEDGNILTIKDVCDCFIDFVKSLNYPIDLVREYINE